ncbi:MAG: cupin domain-containing protein [Proteobacteria bacterium]|nr:cupin domain-containing protein [Pseudomonadota bacterium]
MDEYDGGEVKAEGDYRLFLAETRVAALASSAGLDDVAAEFGNLLVQTEAVGFSVTRLGAGDNPVARAQMPGILARPFARHWERLAAISPQAWNRLPWTYSYEPGPGVPDLSDSVAFAELAGPNAPFQAQRTRIGFTLIAPNTLYPWHAHPAREIYIVLSGRACWSQDHETGFQEPGAVIYHAPGVPHAMRTEDEPLLAFYAWRGAIEVPSRYVPPPR